MHKGPYDCMALYRRLGLELGKCVVLKYSNQETSVTIGESGMRDSFIPRLSLLHVRSGEGHFAHATLYNSP